jgi:hypothetical protein
MTGHAAAPVGRTTHAVTTVTSTSSSDSRQVPAGVAPEDRQIYLQLLRIYGSQSAALAALRAMKLRQVSV